jgi:hypothetical protein
MTEIQDRLHDLDGLDVPECTPEHARSDRRSPKSRAPQLPDELA